jgi:hypothetical protein
MRAHWHFRSRRHRRKSITRLRSSYIHHVGDTEGRTLGTTNVDQPLMSLRLSQFSWKCVKPLTCCFRVKRRARVSTDKWQQVSRLQDASDGHSVSIGRSSLTLKGKEHLKTKKHARNWHVQCPVTCRVTPWRVRPSVLKSPCLRQMVSKAQKQRQLLQKPKFAKCKLCY